MIFCFVPTLEKRLANLARQFHGFADPEVALPIASQSNAFRVLCDLLELRTENDISNLSRLFETVTKLSKIVCLDSEFVFSRL